MHRAFDGCPTDEVETWIAEITGCGYLPFVPIPNGLPVALTTGTHANKAWVVIALQDEVCGIRYAAYVVDGTPNIVSIIEAHGAPDMPSIYVLALFSQYPFTCFHARVSRLLARPTRANWLSLAKTLQMRGMYDHAQTIERTYK